MRTKKSENAETPEQVVLQGHRTVLLLERDKPLHFETQYFDPWENPLVVEDARCTITIGRVEDFQRVFTTRDGLAVSENSVKLTLTEHEVNEMIVELASLRGHDGFFVFDLPSIPKAARGFVALKQFGDVQVDLLRVVSRDVDMYARPLTAQREQDQADAAAAAERTRIEAVVDARLREHGVIDA